MSEKTVIITEKDGKYQIENNSISEFALLGILECIVFDMKNRRREVEHLAQQMQNAPEPNEMVQEPKIPVQESNARDVRTRIANAIKAIKGLGGEVEEGIDRSSATDEELQNELENLTNQYKRLKISKNAGR